MIITERAPFANAPAFCIVSVLCLMKRIWILVLSLLLLYGGVAWAVGACLQDDRHVDHTPSGHHSNLPVLGSHVDSQDSSVPAIHCAPVSQPVGPAARVASPEIPRSNKSVALHAELLPGALSTALEKGLWSESLFKKLVMFSSPIEPERYLFLSVFRI